MCDDQASPATRKGLNGHHPHLPGEGVEHGLIDSALDYQVQLCAELVVSLGEWIIRIRRHMERARVRLEAAGRLRVAFSFVTRFALLQYSL